MLDQDSNLYGRPYSDWKKFVEANVEAYMSQMNGGMVVCTIRSGGHTQTLNFLHWIPGFVFILGLPQSHKDKFPCIFPVFSPYFYILFYIFHHPSGTYMLLLILSAIENAMELIE